MPKSFAFLDLLVSGVIVLSLSIAFAVAIGLLGYLVGTYLGLIASAVLFTPAAL